MITSGLDPFSYPYVMDGGWYDGSQSEHKRQSLQPVPSLVDQHQHTSQREVAGPGFRVSKSSNHHHGESAHFVLPSTNYPVACSSDPSIIEPYSEPSSAGVDWSEWPASYPTFPGWTDFSVPSAESYINFSPRSPLVESPQTWTSDYQPWVQMSPGHNDVFEGEHNDVFEGEQIRRPSESDDHTLLDGLASEKVDEPSERLQSGEEAEAEAEARRFKCPHCDQTFRIKGYLTRHVKKHAMQKPYLCRFRKDEDASPCHPTGGFSRKDTFKVHLKARHFVYPPGMMCRDRPLAHGRCGGCGRRFPNNEKWVENHILAGNCPRFNHEDDSVPKVETDDNE